MLTYKTLKPEYVYSSNLYQDTCCRKWNFFTCMLSHFSHVWLFGTLWTVRLSGSTVYGILICSHKFSNSIWIAAAAKSLQSCPTLCDPIDSSPPGSPVPGILQARTLEWVAIFFSNAWKWKVKVKSLSHVWLFETPWTIAYQAPPSMGFPRQEYWSGVPLPSLIHWSRW